jgi:hypothetical protein
MMLMMHDAINSNASSAILVSYCFEVNGAFQSQPPAPPLTQDDDRLSELIYCCAGKLKAKCEVVPVPN